MPSCHDARKVVHQCRDRKESPYTHWIYRCVSSSLRSGHPTRLIVRQGCDADAGHDVLCCRWREEMQICSRAGAFRVVLGACWTVVLDPSPRPFFNSIVLYGSPGKGARRVRKRDWGAVLPVELGTSRWLVGLVFVFSVRMF